MDDNSKLQDLAEKATPGPWAVDDDTYVMCGRGPIFDTEYSGPEDSTRVETYEAADAAFIAAANPATVLALLAEINRLRTAEGDAMTYKAGMESVAQQRDQLKAEVESSRKLASEYARCADNECAEARKLKAENERLTNNRDMWKGQAEQQAKEMAGLRKSLVDVRDSVERGYWSEYAGLDDTRAVLDAAIGKLVIDIVVASIVQEGKPSK